MLEHSVFIRPRDIRTPTDGRGHYVAYDESSRLGYFFSDPTKLAHPIDAEEFFARLSAGVRPARTLGDADAPGLLETLWAVVTEELEVGQDEVADVGGALRERGLSTLEQVGFLTRLYLDTETIVF